MRTLPRNRRVHGSCFPFRPTPNDGQIFLRDALFLHEQTKLARGCGGLGDKHDAARFPIQSIHDRDLPAVGDFEGEQMSQFAPERARAVGFARMNEKQRRFIDHDVVVGFVDDARSLRGAPRR